MKIEWGETMERATADSSDIKKYLELLYFLTIKIIKVRYQQTIFGVLWAILRPFMTMIVFTIVFSKIAKLPSENVPYPIFSFVALVPWTFFSASLTSAVSSLVTYSTLIKQVYVPREIFPISAVLTGLFDFLVSVSLFIVMLIFYRIPITPMVIYAFPLVLLMIVFTLALSLFLSAFNVFYRDVGQVISFVIQLFMFITPVVYSVNTVPPKYQFIYMLNPLAVIIDGFRRVVVHGIAPNWIHLEIAVIVIGVMFILSWKYFKKAELTFADII